MDRPGVTKDHGTNFNHISRSSTSRRQDGDAVGGNSAPIPLDLVIEILKRLPAKSLKRFRCVSKLWSSIIGNGDFINLYLTLSSTRPRILIAYEFVQRGKHFFFSSPYPQNPDVELDSVTNYELELPIPEVSGTIKRHHVRGFVCFSLSLKRFLICNPSTRQFVTLPEMEPKGRITYFSFGYDPVNDQYKVLCALFPLGYDLVDHQYKVLWECGRRWGNSNVEHQVLTFGIGGRKEWRTIESTRLYKPETDWICINGVLYYGASTSSPSNCSTIVSFDVRSEKFNLIRVPHGGASFMSPMFSSLINYKGKLAGVDYFGLRYGNFKLWVLEDAERHEWSYEMCVLPSLWRDLVGNTTLIISGTTRTGEIILTPMLLSLPFYVYYYDMKTNSITRVEIKGIADGEFRRRNGLGDGARSILTFVDHMENILCL